eukprot:GFKZ01001769.1.p1 GENE.GFKZ01001769.1~~GFKZ01001769.1.p1  ORF type:complete len:506 (+),score=75.77 GFKZ01001769.1:275-1792(+)
MSLNPPYPHSSTPSTPSFHTPAPNPHTNANPSRSSSTDSFCSFPTPPEQSSPLQPVQPYLPPNPTPPVPKFSKPLPPHINAFNLRRVHSESSLLVTPSPRTPFSARRHLLSLPTLARKEPYDQAMANRFAARIVSAVNDAAICILISIGHQLGLFRVLLRLNARPHSVGTIAKAARDLHVRYLQEWLSSMACVGIVEEVVLSTEVKGQYVRKYRLPTEHAIFLTWRGQSNLALVTQYIPILGRLEDAVVGCFRSGCGLDVARYAHFHSVASLDAVQTLGSEDGVKLLRHVAGLVGELEEGACVLCLGGMGDGVYIRLARRFPKSWFTCYNGSVTEMKAARGMLEEAGGAANVHFRALTEGLHTIQEQRSYDVALVLDGAAVRNAVRPVEVLKTVRRALQKGKPVVLVETVAEGDLRRDRGHVAGVFLYGVSGMQGLPSAIGMGGGQKERDDVVGGVWGVGRARRAMEEAGFESLQTFSMEDGMNCVIVGRAMDAEQEVGWVGGKE